MYSVAVMRVADSFPAHTNCAIQQLCAKRIVYCIFVFDAECKVYIITVPVKFLTMFGSNAKQILIR